MVYEMTLLYDPECTLCDRFKKTLERIDTKKSFRFVSIYDSNIYIEYPELDKDECHEVIHLIDDNKKIYKGADVVQKIALTIPQVKKFAWLIESQSSKKAMNLFYRKLNDIRLMKKNNCYTCGGKSRK
jgi:predicted DCC family thiol-disulfide oxidoreductase YuxK